MRARLSLRPEPHPVDERSAGVRQGVEPVANARPPAVAAVLTAAATALVAVAAASVAHGFREILRLVAGAVTPTGTQTAAVQALGPWTATAVVTTGVVVAAIVDRRVRRTHDGRLGLHVLAATARDDVAPEPSLRATVARSSATLVATASFASLGREAPILELGAAAGDGLGRLTRLPRHRLVASGIAAAFAVAYHAPIAAVLYLVDHVGIRRDRATLTSAVAGALLGWWLAARWFEAAPVFPTPRDPWASDTAVLVALGLVPAWVASRLFLGLRLRLVRHVEVDETRRFVRRLALAAPLAGLVVALVPTTAGNGMDAIRLAHERPELALAAALLLGKLVATTATLAAGAPGGVLSPSLAVAAGAAMLSWEAADAVGVPLPTDRWTALVVLMSIGAAVSLRSPVVAAVLLAEMSGRLTLAPLTALVVVIVVVAERALGGHGTSGDADIEHARRAKVLSSVVRDDDA